jgi:CelD/BcsL family acetyltransferase involved in cellulose biosynthesis
VAKRLGLALHPDGGMSAPYLDLTDRARVAEATERRKLRKDEARMRREGPLRFRTARADDLAPWLEQFFSQHESRWSPEGGGGLQDDGGRAFVSAVVHAGHRAGWLRFTMLEWKGRPAAFDITLLRGSRDLTYLVSRDAAIGAHSPGTLLERHMMRAALESGARRFDFGLGDEPYKLIHASGVTQVSNWFLYPE